jgi:hypothetical protein
MAFLTINGTEYEAQVIFKFRRTAEKKYSKKGDKGNDQDGFTVIYNGLLEGDVGYLSAFWDCALSHVKEKPSLDAIEEALLKSSGDDQDFEPLFKEAFGALDKSGFFRQQVRNFWKNVDIMKDFTETEKEQEAAEQMINEMKANRERLTKTGKKK